MQMFCQLFSKKLQKEKKYIKKRKNPLYSHEPSGLNIKLKSIYD